MAHIPINHPLRPLYRALAGLIGAYILVFGVVGLLRTWGDPLFDRGDVWVLGLRTNLAFAILSVVYGLVLLAANVIGGNTEHLVNLGAGVLFMFAGMLMMTLMQTEANILNFSMSTVILSLVFGLIVFTAGLYDKVGTAEDEEVERAYRQQAAARSSAGRA